MKKEKIQCEWLSDDGFCTKSAVLDVPNISMGEGKRIKVCDRHMDHVARHAFFAVHFSDSKRLDK